MLIYAGIDEAGLGPIFGPLVVARCVFILEEGTPLLPLPSLWRVLQSAVCRRPGDSRGRIAVNDSKLLYSSAAGLAGLERAVLPFLDQLQLRPGALPQLLEGLAFDELSRRLEHPCYAGAEGAGPLLPLHLTPGQLRLACRRLGRAAARSGVRLAEVSAAVAFEDRFNRLLTTCGNKSLAAWTFFAGHLEAIWHRYGRQQPQVIVDRQGGRIYYLDLLANLFPQARICIQRESPAISEYEISAGERSMRVIVQVESEGAHLPAALASITAKYLRELLMLRFQHFWRQHAPQVRPTCGYHRDGRRFLREIEPFMGLLRLERELLVRRI